MHTEKNGAGTLDTAAPGQRQEVEEAPESTAQQHRVCLAQKAPDKIPSTRERE